MLQLNVLEYEKRLADVNLCSPAVCATCAVCPSNLPLSHLVHNTIRCQAVVRRVFAIVCLPMANAAVTRAP